MYFTRVNNDNMIYSKFYFLLLSNRLMTYENAEILVHICQNIMIKVHCICTYDYRIPFKGVLFQFY